MRSIFKKTALLLTAALMLSVLMPVNALAADDLNAGPADGSAASDQDAARSIELNDPEADGSYSVPLNGSIDASKQSDAVREGILRAVVKTPPEGTSLDDAVVECSYSFWGLTSWCNISDNSFAIMVDNIIRVNSTADIRITYPAAEQLPAVSAEVKAVFKESRSTVYDTKTGPYSINFRHGTDEPSPEAVYNAVMSSPAYDASAVKVEYLAGSSSSSWRSISAAPSDVQHAFGTQESEKIRISYSSADSVFQLEAELKIIDDRAASSIALQSENVSYKYRSYTAEQLMKAIAPQVTAEDGTVIDGAQVSFAEDIDAIEDLNVGQHQLTLRFAGNADLKPSQAIAYITVEKASCTIDISNVTMKYTGAPANAAVTTDPAGVSYICFAAGMDASSADIKDGKLQGAITDLYIIVPELEGVSSSAKLSELINMLPMLGLPADSLEAISEIIKLLPENVQNIPVTIGGSMPSNTGAYLTGAVTIDSNYETAFDVGYLVISPEGSKAVLDWKTPIENGFVTPSALSDIDLGAKIASLENGDINEASNGLINIFYGLDGSGHPLITQDQNDLTPGAFTEFSFLLKYGNKTYYAEPLVRAFTVTPDRVRVALTGGDSHYDGKPHAMTAALYNADGTQITDFSGVLSVHYYGVSYSGKVWNSADAPTEAGVYTVTATYTEKDENGSIVRGGMDVAVMHIFKADAPVDDSGSGSGSSSVIPSPVGPSSSGGSGSGSGSSSSGSSGSSSAGSSGSASSSGAASPSAPSQPAPSDTASCDGKTDCPIVHFSDVDTSKWYHEAVDWAVKSGTMKGLDNESFSPDGHLSRAMLMTMLARMDGVDTEGSSVWYEKGLQWAVENGISDGTDPLADITREQTAAMLYRYAKLHGQGFSGDWMFMPDFSDRSSISEYAFEPVCWMNMNSILNGKGASVLDPRGKTTRAEASQMLMKLCEKLSSK